MLHAWSLEWRRGSIPRMRFLGVLVVMWSVVSQAAPSAPSGRSVRRVRVAERELRQILRFEVSVAPRELAALGSPSAGLVHEVLVDAGTVVKKGQRLVGISPARGGKVWSVLAPFDGVVISRSAVAGVYVGEGVPVVTVASSLSSLRAEIDVPEVLTPLVKIAAIVTLSFETYRDRVFQATISSCVPWIDARTRTQHCDAALPNPDLGLIPGMSGTASLVVGQHKGLAAPTAAISREGDRAYVLRAVAGKAAKAEVRLGITDGDFVELVSGAVADDELLIGAQDGQKLD